MSLSATGPLARSSRASVFAPARYGRSTTACRMSHPAWSSALPRARSSEHCRVSTQARDSTSSFARVAPLPGVTLVIAGQGPAHDDLLGLARNLGVEDRVHLVGWTDAPRDLLAGIDVFALSSLAESFPLSILEAMLASLPVVATDVGSVREEVVDGETGFVIAPGDVDALSQAMQRLLADPGLRTLLGSKGRERAQETFTSTAMSRSYEALYDTVLNSRRAEARA